MTFKLFDVAKSDIQMNLYCSFDVQKYEKSNRMVMLLSFNIKELIEEIKKRNIHSYFNGYLYILIK